MSATSATSSAPSLALLGAEPLRALLEFAGTQLWPRRRDALGDGHPVVLFPGLASDGLALGPLKTLCRSLGHPACDWGRGFNTGPTGDLDEWISDLADDVARLIEPHGQRASLIGWSLGGVYAREIARQRPELVRQVVTIGTPFAGTVAQTRAGWAFRLLNGQPAPSDEALQARLRRCPPVPTTSIYSRSDGVVAWQACQQVEGRGRFENVEVQGSHLGLGWNPQVFDVIAGRLAQPDGARRGSARAQAEPDACATPA